MIQQPRLRDYLALGWKIFPLHSIGADGKCTCGRGDACTSPGKHPRTAHGLLDATDDPTQVQQWAVQYGGACNWGLATGETSGVIVIDIDTKHGDGYASLRSWEERNEAQSPTLVANTGSGGEHRYYAWPGRHVKTRVNWLASVDVRGDGGYVVLPPGRHLSGGVYSWENWGHAAAQMSSALSDELSSAKISGKPALTSQQIDSLGGFTWQGVSMADALVNGVPEGMRDDWIFRCACALRRSVSKSMPTDLAKQMILVVLNGIGDRSGFERDEVLGKVNSAFRQDHTDGASPDFLAPTDGSDELWLTNLTDAGNRARLADLTAGRLLYRQDVGWYEFSSERGWHHVPSRVARYQAEAVGRKMMGIASEIDDAKAKHRYTDFVASSMNRARLDSMMDMCQGAPEFLREQDDFDQEALLLPVANGMIDLSNGRLLPFSQDVLYDRSSQVVYDADADYGWWSRYVLHAVDGDEQMAQYLQEAVGYTCTGLISEECFFVISGPPQSGKSTFIDGLNAALGDWAHSIQGNLLMMRRGKDTRPDDLASLVGYRAITVSETRSGDTFDEALVKQLTGGDRITARKLYGEPFDFRPAFKLWIGSNFDAFSSDPAMVRRIKRISFPKSIPADQRDPKLKDLVRSVTGAQAILHWAVDGAIRYLAHGQLSEPVAIRMAAEAYRAEGDVVGSWLQDNIEQGSSTSASLTDLYTDYSAWCEANGEFAIKRRSLLQELRNHGYAESRDDDGRQSIVGLQVRNNTLLEHLGY